MNKKIILISLISSFATIAFADDYLRDESSGQVVRSGTGLCWRTGYWTPAGAIKECDPEYFKEESKVEKKIIKLNSDVLFKFNSFVLSEKGKEQLDNLLKNTPTHTKVDIVGHTDRIGSESYNVNLSKERANSVANYVRSQRSSLALTTSGVGFSQPSGETSQCKGNKVNKSLIECLAPDRRVIITLE